MQGAGLLSTGVGPQGSVLKVQGYKNDKENYSFAISASTSGILWSLTHILNVLCGSQNWGSVTVSIVLAFILAFPSAYLFERGGNRIWGWWLVHFAFNSQMLVNIGGNAEAGAVYVSGGLFLSLIITFPLARWILPNKSLLN